MTGQSEALANLLADAASEKVSPLLREVAQVNGQVVLLTVQEIAEAGQGLADDGWSLQEFVNLLRGSGEIA